MPPSSARLDGTLSDIAVGGGGRYLLLTLKKAEKLAIFDVNVADIVKTIPLARRMQLSLPGQGSS